MISRGEGPTVASPADTSRRARQLKAVLKRTLPALVPVIRFVRRISNRPRMRDQVFERIIRNNEWLDDESVSGPGSSLRETVTIRRELPRLVQALGIKSLLDAPCGDYNWMGAISLRVDRYVGIDIVRSLVDRNERLYHSATVSFMCRDLACDPVPGADLVLCRDCLVHLVGGKGADKSLGLWKLSDLANGSRFV